MTADYAEGRIREALRLANGNQMKARQQVMAWLYEDAKLLHALAKPHMNGIIAYNIERIASGRADKRDPEAPPALPPLSQARLRAGQDPFGLELLKAVAGGDAAMFGLESAGAPPPKRGPASPQHIEALKKISVKTPPKKK